MSRYIDADSLKKRIGDLHFKNYGMAIIAVLDAPTADVVEVRHGEWIQSRSKFGLGQSNCSECNGYVDGYTSYRYCPHCGAKIIGIREKNDA